MNLTKQQFENLEKSKAMNWLIWVIGGGTILLLILVCGGLAHLAWKFWQGVV